MSLWKKFWQITRSVKLALVLISVLTATIASLMFYTKLYNYEVAQAGFRSWWFLLLSFAFLLNLTSCLAEQFFRLAGSYNKLGKKTKTRRIGLILFHLGLILVVTGSFVTNAYGMSGYIMIGEGETRLENHNDYDVLEESTFFREIMHYNFALKLLKQSFLYDQDGTVKDIKAVFQITDGDKTTDINLTTGSSVTYRGIRMFFYRDGFTPKIFVTKKNGELIWKSSILIDTIVDNDGRIFYKTDAFSIQDLPFKIDFTFFPDLNQKNSRSNKLTNPALQVIVRQENKILAQKVIKPNEPLVFADYKLFFNDIKRWTGIKLVRNPGEKLVYGGYLIALLGLLLAHSLQLFTYIRNRSIEAVDTGR